MSTKRCRRSEIVASVTLSLCLTSALHPAFAKSKSVETGVAPATTGNAKKPAADPASTDPASTDPASANPAVSSSPALTAAMQKASDALASTEGLRAKIKTSVAQLQSDAAPAPDLSLDAQIAALSGAASDLNAATQIKNAATVQA